MSIADTIKADAAAVASGLQSFLAGVGDALSAGVATVATATQLLTLAQAVTAKGNPDQTDWDALHTILDANTAAFNKPLPD